MGGVLFFGFQTGEANNLINVSRGRPRRRRSIHSEQRTTQYFWRVMGDEGLQGNEQERSGAQYKISHVP